jgi:hypothetical protein
MLCKERTFRVTSESKKTEITLVPTVDDAIGEVIYVSVPHAFPCIGS